MGADLTRAGKDEASGLCAVREHRLTDEPMVAYIRFQRAGRTGSLNIVRAAAAELPRVDLRDALSLRMAIRDAERERFERAALSSSAA